jgi:hypothetical protein
MTQRHTGRSGKQLKPLNQRMTAADLQIRAARMQARRTVAERLAYAQSMWGAILNSFFTRGFLGRMKWLITGR